MNRKGMNSKNGKATEDGLSITLSVLISSVKTDEKRRKKVVRNIQNKDNMCFK